MTDFLLDGDFAFLFRDSAELRSFIKFCKNYSVTFDESTFCAIFFYWEEINLNDLIYYKGVLMLPKEYKEKAPIISWKTWLEEYENELRNPG